MDPPYFPFNFLSALSNLPLFPTYNSNPSCFPINLPSTSSNLPLHPLMSNFLSEPSGVSLPFNPMNEVGGAIMHFCSNAVELTKRVLEIFWREQKLELEQAPVIDKHQLPIGRIRRTMKSNEDVKMISYETTFLLSKACEFFIMELTIRSWLYTEERWRQTLQRNDIASAIYHSEMLGFLVNVVPKCEMKEYLYNHPEFQQWFFMSQQEKNSSHITSKPPPLP